MTTHSDVEQQKRAFSSSRFAFSSPELPPVPAQFPHSAAACLAVVRLALKVSCSFNISLLNCLDVSRRRLFSRAC